MPEEFAKDSAKRRLLLAWWEGLEDDRASRAVLRRAQSITAVALTAPFQRVYRQLRAVGWNADNRGWMNDRLAAVVGLLAHLRISGELDPAKAMSQREKGSDRPVVSELRFLRLLDVRDLDDLFSALRRVLPLIDDKVDVLALANDVLGWGELVKKKWAYAYEWPAKSAA